MNILTRKEDDVIVYVAKTTETVINGILVDNDMVFGNADQYNVFEDVTVPEGVEQQAYKYTSTGGFAKNADYVPYVSPEEKVKQLETDLINSKLAMAELAEQQEADKLNNQLALAEVIESIMGGGTAA
ncbi:hypothetical protein [Acetobacterium tundrae]|uniref:DUF2977 domain-containing protein n=1 Tax=Acetobacterium tundrae TaxID=132932 RepID=A0ABR6WIW2_9FIRM|nr:hypothetical protein [Acetobacterium tundrae]MBC3796425.1 hypothetical protein [Acetobacterium tundrae]